MVQRWFAWNARFALRRYREILIFATVLTAVCGYFVCRLVARLETNIAALLPEDYPSVRTLEEIKARVGGTDNMVVLVECPDFEASRRFAEDLVEALEGETYRKYVRYIDYRRDVDFFKQRALLYAELEDLEEIRDRIEDRVRQEKVKLSPLFIRLDDDEPEDLDFSDLEGKYKEEVPESVYYTNPDSTILAIRVVAAGTTGNLGFARAMYAALQEAVAALQPASYHPLMQVEYGGTFKSRIDEYEVIVHDITSTLAYGILGVALLLALYFRQPLAVCFVALPLVMGLAWAFGITYWTIGRLNTMTGFLFVILFGLGIDFGIHLFARYLEDRAAGMDVGVSLEKMLTQTGRAMLTSGLTTAAAFYSLMITDFRGFSEFGFIVGTGIVTSMLAMTTVLPAALILADRDLGWVRPRAVWGHSHGGEREPFPAAWPVLIVCTAATAYLGFNLHRVGFEYDFTNLRANLPASAAVKRKMDTIRGFGTLSQSPSVALAGSKEELDEVVAAVEARMAADDSTPTIETVKTLWSALPDRQEEKLAVIAEIRDLVDGEGAKLLKGEQRKRVDEFREYLDVQRVGVEDLPESVLRKFSGVNGSQAYFAFIYPGVPLRDGRNAMAFAEDTEAIVTASGKTVRSSSSNIILADMLRVMMRDSRTAVTITGLVVFTIVLIDFRSLHRTLLVMLPLACGMVWMVGSMVVSGMTLNFYNMVALPSVIGMGIDNAVHLYHRYREEGPGSLPLVLRRTGGAMLACLLTTMVGFAGLMTAQHPGLNSIGKLALIGLGACFLAAVTLLPALLQVAENAEQGEIKKVA